MKPSTRQSGITLVLAMIFLLAISLLAVASFNSGTTNMRVTGNMIARQEAVAAAQALIDDTVSATFFATDPAAVAAAPFPVDINQDGTTDINARLVPAPFCQRARVVKAAELATNRADDRACMLSGVVAHSGVETEDAAATAGDSLCAQTQWNLRAVAQDPLTGADVAVNQGVSIRQLATEAEDSCT